MDVKFGIEFKTKPSSEIFAFQKKFNRTGCWVFLTQPCAVCDAIKRGSGGSSGHSSVPPRPRLTTESAQFSVRGKPRLPIAL